MHTRDYDASHLDRLTSWPVGQLLTGLSRIVALSIAGTLAIASVSAGVGCSPAPDSAVSRSTQRGGEIVVSVRSNPTTFNRLTSSGRTDDLVSMLTGAKLVRINRATEQLEPWLAESWSRSADGLSYTLKLRPHVAFSDGHPFTSDDVVFSFEAAYDEKTGSPVRAAMEVGGKRLLVATPDPQTVTITFPSPFGPGVRILDNLPILPRHKLGPALDAGTFSDAWGLSTPLADLTGLGPFVLSEFTRGQRLVFARNPHYWRKDAGGAPLPYLDRITMEIVPEQDAELLRLESGQIDMTASEIRPSDYAPLKRLAEVGKIQLLDVGEGHGTDAFWINLKPGALGKDPRAAWLQKDELRHAISSAVDREVFVNVVYLGAGVPVFGPVTPANKQWYAADVPRVPHDPARAKQLLASIGLADSDGDGVLEDSRRQPARFTLITQKGRTDRERATAVIRDELKKIGLVVDVVALEFGAVLQRIMSGNYESAYLGPDATALDPAMNLDYWLSSGSAHFWNIGQKTPATEWERRIDELMGDQVAASNEGERRRLFAEVQKLFAEHAPAIYFAAPRIYVAVSARMANLAPSPMRPQLLWAADTIAVANQ